MRITCRQCGQEMDARAINHGDVCRGRQRHDKPFGYRSAPASCDTPCMNLISDLMNQIAELRKRVEELDGKSL